MSLSTPFYFLTGLFLFLYGMFTMGRGLKELAHRRLKNILCRMTATILRSFWTGLWVTALVQSSSVVTVMAVGFVQAGILELRQVVGIIIGANIGTTVTAQLLRLSLPFSFRLGQPAFFYVLIFTATLLLFFRRKPIARQTAVFLIGFTLILTGMHTMELAAVPLQRSPYLQELFLITRHPLTGIGIGALTTAFIQSSSAAVGILQALSSTGALSWSAAIPLLLGQNIGTSVTALLASIGAGIQAKRAALLHLYFNLIGTALFSLILYILPLFSLSGSPIDSGGIANFHTLFNTATGFLLFPFSDFLVHLVTLSLPERKCVHKKI